MLQKRNIRRALKLGVLCLLCIWTLIMLLPLKQSSPWPVYVEQLARDVVAGKEGKYIQSRNQSLHDTQSIERQVVHNILDIPPGYFRYIPGYGNNNTAVVINKEDLSPEELQKYEEGWRLNEFNQYVSDLISPMRTLPDVRDPECLNLHYPSDLPDASVVIIFHDEAWSTLLRTVYSVLTRSPEHLIREIILVDDYSDLDHLTTTLPEYVESYLPKVRVLRTGRREGLIRARLLGASNAKGQVVVFLDAHCECTKGWLEPLLFELKKDRTMNVSPVIDIIDDTNLKYKHWTAKTQSAGGFTWQLKFKWVAYPQVSLAKQKTFTDPIATPTMQGGIFAVNRKYFFEIGAYDPDMDIWGGENIELPFRTWMCGGSVTQVPCSRVGHVYRMKAPPALRTGSNDALRNAIRVAEVWLDDYKNYFYQRHPFIQDYLHQLRSDVSERKALRQKLNCTNFQWYLKNVWPEMLYVGDSLISGRIRSKADLGRCVEPQIRGTVIAGPCGMHNPVQLLSLTKEKHIRQDDRCLIYIKERNELMFIQYKDTIIQGWHYEQETLKNTLTNTCLELSADHQNVLLSPCSTTDKQKWLWEDTPASNFSMA